MPVYLLSVLGHYGRKHLKNKILLYIKGKVTKAQFNSKNGLLHKKADVSSRTLGELGIR